MASVIRQKNGRKMIQFIDAGGKRATIRLGKVSQRQADAVKIKVENLVAAKLSGHAVDDETARWVAKLDSVLADKLACVGLIPKQQANTLLEFTEYYIAKRTDLKPRSVDILRRTQSSLIAFFGANKCIGEITAGESSEWRKYLFERGGVSGGPLSVNTVNDRCKKAKQFFRAAIDYELVTRNPFEKLPGNVRANPEKQYFVTEEETRRLMDACPNAEWRLLVALCRYGGMRSPSETLNLKWEHVDFEKLRMTVPSPKTERYDGKSYRTVPIFPEIAPFLEDSWELAPPGEVHVLRSWRSEQKNLRTRLHKIIRRAGLNPWPRAFHNLRASRQTELEDQFPSHVVCCWLGNSERVARDHYLQVTEDHFQRATQPTTLALQNALQHSAVSGSMEGQTETANAEMCPVFPIQAFPCDAVHNEEYTRRDSNPQPSVPKTDALSN